MYKYGSRLLEKIVYYDAKAGERKYDIGGRKFYSLDEIVFRYSHLMINPINCRVLDKIAQRDAIIALRNICKVSLFCIT